MTKAEIYDNLAEVMRDVFDDDTIAISSQTTAQDIAGWDSQAHVMLIVAAEQRFGVRFRTSEFEALHNVGDFVDLILLKLERV
ncbi:acyl carrier protein [Sphingomonas oryzagri]|uniref:Acyl carrier protein n=1 Tax=Sphingomonas oryzagri TaxID=3042314 RepID=A0ABT6N371_9SPHN|nr:acyl carrier protein [Sphingomonas oryzagri]MDH7639199.1 acyl carrier protein [Sphingomonas oryzagri]